MDVNRMFLTDSHGVRRHYQLREPSSQGGFHLYFAHCWPHEAQCYDIQRSLQAMRLGCQCFLEVENLRFGSGAQWVARCDVLLLFFTKGTSVSRACRAELLAAYRLGKPVIIIHEAEVAHGADSFSSLSKPPGQGGAHAGGSRAGGSLLQTAGAKSDALYADGAMVDAEADVLEMLGALLLAEGGAPPSAAPAAHNGKGDSGKGDESASDVASPDSSRRASNASGGAPPPAANSAADPTSSDPASLPGSLPASLPGSRRPSAPPSPVAMRRRHSSTPTVSGVLRVLEVLPWYRDAHLKRAVLAKVAALLLTLQSQPPNDPAAVHDLGGGEWAGEGSFARSAPSRSRQRQPAALCCRPPRTLPPTRLYISSAYRGACGFDLQALQRAFAAVRVDGVAVEVAELQPYEVGLPIVIVLCGDFFSLTPDASGRLRYSALLSHTSRLLENAHEAVTRGPAHRHVKGGATLRAAIECGLVVPLFAVEPGWEVVTRGKGQLGELWELRGLFASSKWNRWLEPDRYGGDDPGWLQRVVAAHACAGAERAGAHLLPPTAQDEPRRARAAESKQRSDGSVEAKRVRGSTAEEQEEKQRWRTLVSQV